MAQETTSLLTSSVTTEVSSDILKTSIDEGETIKLHEIHEPDATNKIDMDDSVARNNFKTRKTAVVWL